jgi:hypothetical protein
VTAQVAESFIVRNGKMDAEVAMSGVVHEHSDHLVRRVTPHAAAPSREDENLTAGDARGSEQSPDLERHGPSIVFVNIPPVVQSGRWGRGTKQEVHLERFFKKGIAVTIGAAEDQDRTNADDHLGA